MTSQLTAVCLAIAVLAGCKNQSKPPASAAATNSEVPQDAAPSNLSAAPQAVGRVEVPTDFQYSEPPIVTVGPSVEQAYAAIPHRRTIWAESETTVPVEERAYLKTVFLVLDQAVRVRVAGQQDFTNRQFNSANISAEFDRLITFTRAMPVPKSLASYHGDILNALTSERQFFDEWKSQGGGFQFGQHPENHAGVRAASASLRAGYGKLMSKYPNESPANKDAFFDYHCALDFL